MSQGRGSPGGTDEVSVMSAAGAAEMRRLTFAESFAFSCAQLGTLALRSARRGLRLDDREDDLVGLRDDFHARRGGDIGHPQMVPDAEMADVRLEGGRDVRGQRFDPELPEVVLDDAALPDAPALPGDLERDLGGGLHVTG